MSLLRYASLSAVLLRLSSANAIAVQYRAHATVLLLGVPILRRDNVGSGYLNVREKETGNQRRIRLEFGAGSLPTRAAGLNRLGIFEEDVVESSTGEVESAAYFGYMTTSNEKDLKQATDALEKGGEVSYSAIRGNIEKGKLWNRLMKVRDNSKAGWEDRTRLTPLIRARLNEESPADAQHATASMEGLPCGTFLHAIRGAMRSQSPKSHARFVHNGKVHQLRTDRKSVV